MCSVMTFLIILNKTTRVPCFQQMGEDFGSLLSAFTRVPRDLSGRFFLEALLSADMHIERVVIF